MDVTCERCGASFARKQHLIAHLQRKKPCPTDLKDTPREALIQTIQHPQTAVVQAAAPFEALTGYVLVKSSEYDDMVKELEALRQEKRQQTTGTVVNTVINGNGNQINQINQINQTINQTNIIVVNPFGQETMDHISDEEVTEYLKKYNTCFVDFVNKIYYGVPENNNVRLRSLKKKHMEIFDGDEWIVKCASEILSAMIQKTNDLGSKVYNASDELKELDATEPYEYRMRKMLISLGAQRNNRIYYDFANRLMAHMVNKREEVK